MIGATILKQLEVSAGYRAERVTISEGSSPNRLKDSIILSGLAFHLHRDSLDSADFLRTGAMLHAQFDKRTTYLGGDLDYSKLQVDYQRYFTVSGKSTLRLNVATGYATGPVPFYD